MDDEKGFWKYAFERREINRKLGQVDYVRVFDSLIGVNTPVAQKMRVLLPEFKKILTNWKVFKDLETRVKDLEKSLDVELDEFIIQLKESDLWKDFQRSLSSDLTKWEFKDPDDEFKVAIRNHFTKNRVLFSNIAHEFAVLHGCNNWVTILKDAIKKNGLRKVKNTVCPVCSGNVDGTVCLDCQRTFKKEELSIEIEFIKGEMFDAYFI